MKSIYNCYQIIVFFLSIYYISSEEINKWDENFVRRLGIYMYIHI